MFVSAVLVITFLRKTNKVIEMAAWIGLVGACAAAVIGIRDPQTQSLTTSTAWGISQVVATIASALKLDALRWTYGERFVIAAWVVLLLGADVLALALVSTKRQAGPRVPANKLREWWVLPRLPGAQSVRPHVASAVDEINQRFNTWSLAAALAAAVWSMHLLIWVRDVEIPNAALALRKVCFPALGGLRQSGTRRTSSTASPMVIAASSRAPKRVTSTAAPRGSRSTHTVSARDGSAGRRADRRRETNGSKKRRQSRLAS